MRTALLLLLFSVTTKLSAQRYPDQLKKGLDIFNESMEYLAKKTDPVLTAYDTNHLLANFIIMDNALSQARAFGDEFDSNVANYYTAIFEFRLGFMLAEGKDHRHALVWYGRAENDFKKFREKGAFPFKYRLGEDEYKVDGSYFNTIYPIMYRDMVNCYNAIKSTDSVEVYARRTLDLKDLSNFERFRMQVILIQCLEEKKQENKEMLTLVLSLWRSYKRLDTAEQRKNFIPDVQFLERTKYLTDKVYATEDRGTTPAMVARTMFEFNRNEDAEFFLKLAIQKQPNLDLSGLDDEFYYRAMMNSYIFKDKDVMKWSSTRLVTSSFPDRRYADDVLMVLRYLGQKDDIKVYKYNLKHH